MKMTFKGFSIVALCAAMLAGCGSEPEFDQQASAYFNEHVGPMTKLPGTDYEVSLTQEGRVNDACTATARIDGRMVFQFGASAGFKAGGVSRCEMEGVVIRWSQVDGYSVSTGKNHNFPREIAAYIAAEDPRIFASYK